MPPCWRRGERPRTPAPPPGSSPAAPLRGHASLPTAGGDASPAPPRDAFCRDEFYRLADLEVRLEGGPDEAAGAPAAEVAVRVLATLEKRIRNDAKEREEKRNFDIVDEGASMKALNDAWPDDMKMP